MADRIAALQASLVGRYSIVREIGRGGMATVYLARDLKHDRPVALKVLRPELAAALGSERFDREIKLAARLQHPHVLSVYDSGEHAGQLWFTMPFVDGESLRERLRREKQLSVEEAVRLVREVAEALDYSHRQGVIHRDIKPENILLAEGHALVADFGIARALGSTSYAITSTGVAIGTPGYMSPEQSSGRRELDARTDVYALGCVLFEVLAGEPPFTGPTPQAIIARSLTESPRPLHPARANVPEALDAVIAKSMANIPADRYASAAELSRALEAASRTGARKPALTVRRLASLLAFGLVVGVVLFALRRPDHIGTALAAKRVAVLPFENLGSPDEQYFADGMTEAVRGKLTELPSLQVTARSSSNQYKATTKTPQQVGNELGVEYLLTATIRWQRRADGTSRVLVTPELVRTASASTSWQEPFDASDSDVFEVQAKIASKVAQAIEGVLDDSVRQRLVEPLTHSLAAYDAYLRGEEVSQDLTASDLPTLRRSATYFAQAVALDSGFAQAWALLSRTHSAIYLNGTPSPDEAATSLREAERAIALAPNHVEGHVALGTYYLWVVKDIEKALTEYRTGQKLAPSDLTVLRVLAGIDWRIGRWEESLALTRQLQALDPRSYFAAERLTFSLLMMRRYPEARQAHERALALASPTSLQTIGDKAMIHLAEGDLMGARAELKSAPPEVDRTSLAAFLGNYWDLYWLLDEEGQRLLLSLKPAAFDDDRAVWGTVQAETRWNRGDQTLARVYADSARMAYEQQLKAAPNDAQRHVLYGLSLAYVGRKSDAVREGLYGVSQLPISKDAFEGAYLQHQLVRIYILVGEPEKALDELTPLLQIPYYLSPGWLRIDPTFDPLRKNPRFQRLAAGD